MGVLPRASQSHTNSSVSHTATLDTQVQVGDPQYVMVESDATNPHVWPAGWTVKFGAAGGPGYVSVGFRVRQIGDGNPTITNGGHTTSWSSTAVAMAKSGTNAVSINDEQAQNNGASSASVVTPTASSTGGHDTVLILVGCTRANTLTANYPFSATLLDGAADGFAPPCVFLPTFATAIPSYTFTQSGASPSVAFVVVALTVPDALGYQANRDSDADYVDWHGYNKYPLQQNSWGGGISVT